MVDFTDESEDDENTEEFTDKIDKRATLLAETLHTIIETRQTAVQNRILQSQVNPLGSSGLKKNNPFIKNHSSTDLFKLGAQEYNSARSPMELSVGN